MIQIEKELIQKFIEDDISVLVAEIDDVIITLDHLQSLTRIEQPVSARNLKRRMDEIKRAIKYLIDLRTSEFTYESSCDICNLSLSIDEILQSINIYGRDRNVSFSSSINSAINITWNNQQFRTMFKKLFILLIKEFECGGKVEISGQKENQDVIITLNVFGTMKFEIAYESMIGIKELFSNKCVWKKQVSTLLLISHALKLSGSCMTINKITFSHRIITIILRTKTT